MYQTEINNRTSIHRSRVCVILARVSTIQQAEDNGIERQKKICQEYAKRNGIEVGGYIEHIGESVKSAENVCREITDYIDNHKHINTVLVYSNDRITRSFEALRAIKEYLNTKGVVLISVTDTREC